MDRTAERRLRAATARRRRYSVARDEERDAILAALDEGMKQVDIVRITGYTREHIRRVAERARDRHAS